MRTIVVAVEAQWCITLPFLALNLEMMELIKDDGNLIISPFFLFNNRTVGWLYSFIFITVHNIIILLM